MKILLSNDDGIHSGGLWAIYAALISSHQVVVVAPDRERTAVSHAITLLEPLRTFKTTVNGGYEGYAVTGTPADCIKLGLLELMDTRPDLVISGINPGANVGVNINYSGTVAAAKEAALNGVPALAVSMDGFESLHYPDAADFVKILAGRALDMKLPRGTFLNVNIPNLPKEKIKGVRFSPMDQTLFCEHFDKRKDPWNRTYYWQGCDSRSGDLQQNSDGNLLFNNYITITPIKCDMTDYDMLDTLSGWRF